jgi:hypothetical protein
MIEKVTSGGIDRGARPICDEQEFDEEKGRLEVARNAGRRNEGRDIRDGEAIALSTPIDLAVENMIIGGSKL